MTDMTIWEGRRVAARARSVGNDSAMNIWLVVALVAVVWPD